MKREMLDSTGNDGSGESYLLLYYTVSQMVCSVSTTINVGRLKSIDTMFLSD